MKIKILPVIAALAIGSQTIQAQLNSGSSGSDGALDFSGVSVTTNIVIDMHDHPTGIYNYTSVNIPTNVTVTFIPNANNTPVYWLVQNGVTINGTVSVSGQNATGGPGGSGGGGGPGGYRGGNGGPNGSSGQGPGGGAARVSTNNVWGGVSAGGGSYAGVYGNVFLIPLLGGSGGGSPSAYARGGGGGGAFLLAASGQITLNGMLSASGGSGSSYPDYSASSDHGGGGSGGAVRLVASELNGHGSVNADRIRFDVYESDFAGTIGAPSFTQGIQTIIIPTAGQLPQLNVTSVGGVPVSVSPTGVLATPDAVLSAQQNNPIPIVVSCANLPLHSLITVSVTPATGSPVSATGYNDAGTQSSSTATLSIIIPRGGGLIYATAATSN